MFTGDNSGLWLYRALYKAGFTNKEPLPPAQANCRDGLLLQDCIISAVNRCAPPDNKPTNKEIQNCHEYLDWEIKNLTQAKVYLVLGGIAFNEVKKVFGLKGAKFSHGAHFEIDSNRYLLCSYHPSQQNTFTKRLTEPMFDIIFNKAKHLIKSHSSKIL